MVFFKISYSSSSFFWRTGLKPGKAGFEHHYKEALPLCYSSTCCIFCIMVIG